MSRFKMIYKKKVMPQLYLKLPEDPEANPVKIV